MKAGAIRAGGIQGKASIMAKKTHIRLAAAVAALLSATPALADQVSNFPGGYVHTWTGDHGEDFTVIHSNNTGQNVVTVNRHDGLGPQPFKTPPKPPVTKKYGGSLYNPDTNQTTTIIRGPGGAEVSMVEGGNTLPNHDFWWPTDIKGHSAGTTFNPMTGKTTTLVMDPGMYGRMVEDGNHMRDHEDMVMNHHKAGKKMAGGAMPGAMGGAMGGAMVGGMMGGGAKPGKDWRAEGSAYDPDTGKTTTIVKGPKGSMSMVEDGNTLNQHRNMTRRMPTSRFSGSLYDPDTNTTRTIVGRPGAYGSTVEMGNTLGAH